jgi:two-component system sensor kinase FixL
MGVRASNRDITAQKLAQEETQKQRRELSHVARVTTVGELSAALAHQLNQPLAAILSNAQAAKRFLESESFDLQETKDILTSIIEEDQRASKVIKELSTFLKREEVSKVPLNINDIVKETLSHVQNEADSKKITMKTDLHSDLPLTLGNPTHLQQVLLNLISNGFDAIIDQNSERREMIFKTSKADHQTIQVDVQDSGTGIEDIKMEKIFEPFQSSKSSGMGIGLSINKKIIETHGGKIWATNAVEGGAIFSFTLPVEKI